MSTGFEAPQPEVLKEVKGAADTAVAIAQKSLPAQLAALQVGTPLAIHNELLDRGEKSRTARCVLELIKEGYFKESDAKKFAEALGVADLKELLDDKCEDYWKRCWVATTDTIGGALREALTDIAGEKGTNASLLTAVVPLFTGVIVKNEGDQSMTPFVSETKGSESILADFGKLVAQLGKDDQSQ